MSSCGYLVILLGLLVLCLLVLYPVVLCYSFCQYPRGPQIVQSFS